MSMQIIDYTPTVSVILDQRRASTKPELKGKFPAKIRVTFQEFYKGRKRWNQQYYGTGIFLLPDEFNSALGKTRVEELKEVGRKLRALETKANQIIDKYKVTDPGIFELHFRSGGSLSQVRIVFESKIQELRKNGQISSAENYESALSRITEFGGSEITFGEITEKWLRKFHRWYTSEKVDSEGKIIKTDWTIGALSFHMRCLRHIYKRAIAMNLVLADQYPFGPGRYVIQSVTNPTVSFFDEHVKELFVNYRSEDPEVNYYHDFWRLSYYCNGANFKDILHLQRRDYQPKAIEFDRAKTITTDRKLKKIVVPIAENAPSGKAIREIIARHGSKDISLTAYIFPVLKHSMTPQEKHEAKDKFIRKCNSVCRKIAASLGIQEDVTTYTARHTFAYMKVNVLGGSTEMLQDDLGHGQASTTEEYKKKFALEVKRKYAEGL